MVTQSLRLAVVLSLFASSAFASTGFQCYKKGSSPRNESNYLIFARLNYLERKAPISSADIQVSKNNWVSVQEESLKKFSNKSRNGVGQMNATMRVNSTQSVELALTTNENEGTGAGKFRVLETKIVQDRSGKSAPKNFVKETEVECIFDEML